MLRYALFSKYLVKIYARLFYQVYSSNQYFKKFEEDNLLKKQTKMFYFRLFLHISMSLIVFLGEKQTWSLFHVMK